MRLLLLAVAAMAATTVRAAERPWRVIHGRNVEVFGQQSPRTLRETAIEIEQFRFVLGNLIRSAKQPQALPTEVYLFDDYDAMKPFVPLYQGKPATLAGYCHCGGTDDASLIVAELQRYSETSEIIYHEYTHLLLHSALSAVPVWFNEGFAEYYSTFRLRGDARAEVGRPIDRHVLLLRERFIPLPELLAVDRSSELYNEGTRRSIFYAESWALVHYLLLGRPNGVEVVNQYLTNFAAGAGSVQALEKAVGMPLKAIDTELRAYVRQLTFRAVTYTLNDSVPVEEPDRAATIAPAEATARLGEIQMRVGRVEDAQRRIEAAAQETPPDGRALLALARLRMQQSRRDEAWPALQKAVELAPRDYAAQYLYGLMLLRGEGDRDRTEPVADRARAAHTALAHAIAIRPDSAAALVWLAYADLQLQANLEEARDATTRALALAPGRLDYALQLGEIRARMGDVVGARQLLAPIAGSNVDSEERDQAARILRFLDERERQSREGFAASRETDSVEVKHEDPKISERETLDLSKTVFRLRDVRPGEQRVFGDLVAIDCGPAGVRFRVHASGADAIGTAQRMDDVELTAYGNAQAVTIGCGLRTPPDRVYLTRRADGTTVAVEFMPKDYVP